MKEYELISVKNFIMAQMDAHDVKELEIRLTNYTKESVQLKTAILLGLIQNNTFTTEEMEHMIETISGWIKHDIFPSKEMIHKLYVGEYVTSMLANVKDEK